MKDDVAELQTVPQIAKALRVSTHRVTYVIDTFSIEPTRRIGIARVYDAAGVLAIKAALRRVASRNQMHPSPANTMLG